MPGSVVVGVDGTAEALRAVRWAAAHAGRRGGALRLVHSVEPPGRHVGALLEEAREVATRVSADLPVHVVATDLSVAELLVLESTTASLVVLGTHGHGGFHGQLIGVTVITVAARGHCPLAVMGTADPGSGPVVVGVDGTRTSDAAIDFAIREAWLRGVDLVAVHGLTVPGRSSLGRDQADEVVAVRLAHPALRYPEVGIAREVVADTPGRALLDRAGDAQLVVVGSGRRIGGHGPVLRATSLHLLHHAPCPVVIVRRDHEG